MDLTHEFKTRVREALLANRPNYGGTDSAYAKSLGIDPSAYNRLKKGMVDRLLSDSKWLTIGRELNVNIKSDNWKIARTKVWIEIEDNLTACQSHSRSMILVDKWGIGKSFCAKHLAKQLKNAFYLDCSQCKSKREFIRALARVVGIDNKGKYIDVKSDLKYYLNLIETPLVILDDAGDLDYPAFLELKELWNGTEGQCGWYLIGDDSLQSKIDAGIQKKKVGYGAIFSRFSGDYIRLTPVDPQQHQQYLQRLIGDVASINIPDRSKTQNYVNKCMTQKATLRYLETLIKIAS